MSDWSFAYYKTSFLKLVFCRKMVTIEHCPSGRVLAAVKKMKKPLWLQANEAPPESTGMLKNSFSRKMFVRAEKTLRVLL